MKKTCQEAGLTLVEVIIALAIVSLLAVIALPSYLDSIARARRGDGQAALLHLQLEQEKWRANNIAFADSLSDLDLSSSSADGLYTIAITSADATGFTATATAKGNQTGDTDCSTLTLTQSGATTNTSPARCWKK
jgi:type IV pilus assembly protein PilE